MSPPRSVPQMRLALGNRVVTSLFIAGAFVCLVSCSDRGSLIGNAVVLAAGSWSGDIAIDGVDARVPVRPVRGQLLSLSWNGTPLRRVTRCRRCYMVPWDDGTVLVGATVEDAGFDERTTVAGVRDLLDAACELVPHAWTCSFRGARVGLRPATPDDRPTSVRPDPAEGFRTDA